MRYLYDAWYAAAWGSEVTRTPMARTLLDEPVLLYRTEEGQAVAMSDRCPHRFAPLHKGQLFGDVIRCPYHGLRFDPTGVCVDNPVGEGRIPSKARTRVFPLEERNGIIWLWFGDAPADPDRIVRFDYFDDPGRFALIEGRLTVEANYTLVSDNLLDLSHAEFLHPMLSSPGAGKRVTFNIEQDQDVVLAKYFRPQEPTPGLFKIALGAEAPDLCSQWSNVTWHAPAVLEVEVTVASVGAPKDTGALTAAAHLITPESKARSHYFWRLARDFAIEDEGLSARMTAAVNGAFATEDMPMIEAQERYMRGQEFDQLSPILLQSDGAAMRARRILAAKIETATSPAPS